MPLPRRGTGTEDYTLKKIQRTAPVAIRGTGQITYQFTGLIYIPGSTTADIEFENVTPATITKGYKVTLTEAEAYVGAEILMICALLKKQLIEEVWTAMAVGTGYQQVRLPISPGFDYSEIDNIGLRIHNLDEEDHTFFFTLIGTTEEVPS